MGEDNIKKEHIMTQNKVVSISKAAFSGVPKASLILDPLIVVAKGVEELKEAMISTVPLLSSVSIPMDDVSVDFTMEVK